MLFKIKKCLFLFLTSLLLPVYLYAEPMDDGSLKSYYVGFGMGSSFLQPKTNSTFFVLSNGNDLAYKGLAGYQFNKLWSAEMFYADMGQSKIRSASTGNVVGMIDYQAYGAGGKFQYPVSEEWDVFATAGFGILENKTSAPNFVSITDNIIYTGIGTTWSVAETWELRGEYNFFNNNVQAVTLSIVKRFGPPVSKPRKPEPVNPKSCDDFTVDFGGITFEPASTELSDFAKAILDDLSLQLLKLPDDITFEIRSHADDVGTELYNYQLSLMRSRTVRDYLSRKGIALGRIEAQGYGEWKVNKNDQANKDGNESRRAELVLIGVEKYFKNVKECSGINPSMR